MPQFQQLSGDEASYHTARGYSTGLEVDGRGRELAAMFTNKADPPEGAPRKRHSGQSSTISVAVILDSLLLRPDLPSGLSEGLHITTNAHLHTVSILPSARHDHRCTELPSASSSTALSLHPIAGVFRYVQSTEHSQQSGGDILQQGLTAFVFQSDQPRALFHPAVLLQRLVRTSLWQWQHRRVTIARTTKQPELQGQAQAREAVPIAG